MRRTAIALAAPGLLAMLGAPAAGQDGIGLLVRPPAEIQAEEVHPAPPIPRPPSPSPPSPPRADLVIDPARRPVSVRPEAVAAPVPRPAPLVDEGITILPPLGAGSGSDPLSEGTIAPPIRPEGDRPPDSNPLLPPGRPRDGAAAPARPRGGSDATAARDRDREPPHPPRPDRPRPGPFGPLLDRLAGRPAVAARPGPAAPGRSAGPPPAVAPDDPEAVAALRGALERAILTTEGDRLAALEVLIVGTRVHIRAQASRPWHRRALRRGLEELPMPAGFRSTVEVR